MSLLLTMGMHQAVGVASDIRIRIYTYVVYNASSSRRSLKDGYLAV